MKKKWILIGIVAVFLIVQLFRIDKVNPPSNPANDFITLANPPQEIAQMIKTSCYDCHSNQTVYPWYSNVAPVSWYLKNHINEARHHLNFSEWNNIPKEKVGRKLEGCAEDVQEGYMPLSSYTLMHGAAKLNQDQKQKLSAWFKQLSEQQGEHSETEN